MYARLDGTPIPGPTSKEVTMRVGPFVVVALGDSVMWGQGLADAPGSSHKFAPKVRDWLSSRTGKDVQLISLAHSAAPFNSRCASFAHIPYLDQNAHVAPDSWLWLVPEVFMRRAALCQDDSMLLKTVTSLGAMESNASVGPARALDQSTTWMVTETAAQSAGAAAGSFACWSTTSLIPRVASFARSARRLSRSSPIARV